MKVKKYHKATTFHASDERSGELTFGGHSTVNGNVLAEMAPKE